MRRLEGRELGLLPLIAVNFFSVSGGPELPCRACYGDQGLVNILVGLVAALTGPAAYITFARSERGQTLST